MTVHRLLLISTRTAVILSTGCLTSNGNIPGPVAVLEAAHTTERIEFRCESFRVLSVSFLCDFLCEHLQVPPLAFEMTIGHILVGMGKLLAA